MHWCAYLQCLVYTLERVLCAKGGLVCVFDKGDLSLLLRIPDAAELLRHGEEFWGDVDWVHQ